MPDFRHLVRTVVGSSNDPELYWKSATKSFHIFKFWNALNATLENKALLLLKLYHTETIFDYL